MTEEGRERGRKECIKGRREGGRSLWEGKGRSSRGGGRGEEGEKNLCSCLRNKPRNTLSEQTLIKAI